MNQSRLLNVLACAALLGTCVNLSGQPRQEKKEIVSGTSFHPHELLGFLLRQNRSAFEATLGKPFHTEKKSDGWTANAYHIPTAKDSYLVVFYDKDHATQIELTGTDYSGPTGFLGLRLGNSASKVESTLGKPMGVRHESDEDLDLWDYKNDNYSLEFTADHRLYSVQIVDQAFEAPKTLAGSAEVHAFAEAIRDRNIDRLLEMASGEIECSRGKDFGIEAGAARTVLSDNKSEISGCLKMAADSILALGPEMKGAEDEIRAWTKHAPGTVTKFPATSLLKEVVFVQESRAWRVYEVTFR